MNIESCWYSNDSYDENVSLADCGTNITDITWVEGQHNFSIYANDSANNIIWVDGNFTLDVTSPDLSIEIPASNNTITNDNTQNINYTVTDTYLGSCWYSNDSHGENVSLVDCTTNITDVTWIDGPHNVSVYVNDTHGNEIRGEVNFTIDTTNPALVLLEPANDTESTDTAVDINFSLSDIHLDACWYSNDSYDENITLADCEANITDVTWVVQQHNYSIWANDTAGNEIRAEGNFTLITADTTAPSITIEIPSENSTFTSDTTQNVNYTASDASTISCYYSNDSYSENVTLTDCGTNVTDITWVEGQHNVSIYVNDSAGNNNSANVNFTVDVTSPTLALVSPTNDTLSNDANIGVNYSISDDYLESCWYSNDSYDENISTTCGSNVSGISWIEGQHNYTIYANDSSGNEVLGIGNFTLDLTYPTLTLVSPVNDTETEDTAIGINFTVSDAHLDACWYSNDSYVENVSLTCGNNISIVWTIEQHNYSIWANDTYGNEIRGMGNLTIIDITPPAITIESPANDSNTTDSGINVNYTIDNTNESCWWSNDYGVTNNTLVCGENVTGQTWDEGWNNVTVYANDSFGNINDSAYVSFLLDTTAPTFDNLANQTITGNSSLEYDIDATDSGVGIDEATWALNDTTQFAIGTTGIVTNNTLLNNVTLYWLQVFLNDSLGNALSDSFYINVTPEGEVEPMMNVYLHPDVLKMPYIQLNRSIDFTQ